MTEEKDMITINFYKGKKTYFSYRTMFFNLGYLAAITQRDLNDICFDWIVERDVYKKNEIARYIDSSLKGYNNAFAMFKQYADTIWFNIEDLPKETLETRYSHETISHWLQRIVKRAIANGRTMQRINRILDEEKYEALRSGRVVIYKEGINRSSMPLEKQLYNSKLYVGSLLNKDYKYYLVYLMKCNMLNIKEAYDFYKFGMTNHEVTFTIKALGMNAATGFMSIDEFEKQWGLLFQNGFKFVFKHRKTEEC